MYNPLLPNKKIKNEAQAKKHSFKSNVEIYFITKKTYEDLKTPVGINYQVLFIQMKQQHLGIFERGLTNWCATTTS